MIHWYAQAMDGNLTSPPVDVSTHLHTNSNRSPLSSITIAYTSSGIEHPQILRQLALADFVFFRRCVFAPVLG
jgi:hypothetical protein